MFEALKATLHKYKKWEPLAFFIAGFSFDAFLLHRIDDPLMLIHQATYLTLSALIIAWDLFCEEKATQIPSWFLKIWAYREGILHFMLGTLLNVYTIFYFKSGSFVSSLYFLALLALLLFLNEVRPAQISKNFLRNALFGLCLISYMNILLPILAKTMGLLIFLLSIAVAYAIHHFFLRFLKSRIKNRSLFKDVQLPFIFVITLYSLLYFFKVLPPVPLSMKNIGIYHSIKKEGNQYKLGITRSKWLFWQSGDQNFEARPGDRINCFVQIFSPTRFQDQLTVRWFFKNPKLGWEPRDAVPLSIIGGREDGYRGFIAKANYEAGDWRVSVETTDGREVGRIHFEVTQSSDTQPAEVRYEYR
ncbi:MAG: DUF2914 domain-containing protein [bacterium]